MRPSKNVAVAILLVLCLHQTFVPLARAQGQGPDFPTVAEAVSGAGLTSLAALAARTALNLTDPNLQAIILAPTNDAIASFNATLRGRLNALDNATITSVLLYHIIPTPEPFAVLNSSEIVLPTLLETTQPRLDGLKNITIKPVSAELVYVGGIAPGPFVNVSNFVTAAKSTIYLIDDVLLPPLPSLSTSPFPLTIAAAVSAPTSGVTILNQLVQASPNVSALLSNPDLAVTVFAPSNAAFNSLLAALNLRLSDLLGESALLERVLSNHVIPSRPFTSIDFTPGDSATLPTAFPGDDLTINVSRNSNVTVAGGGNTTPANVTTLDVKAGKSVIHVIDAVLLPAGLAGPADGPTTTPSPAYGTYGPPPSYGVYSPPPSYGTYGPPPSYGVYSPPPVYGAYSPPAYGTYSPPAYPPTYGGAYPPVPSYGGYGSPSPINAPSPSPFPSPSLSPSSSPPSNRSIITPGPTGASASSLSASLLSAVMASLGMLMLWAA